MKMLLALPVVAAALTGCEGYGPVPPPPPLTPNPPGSVYRAGGTEPFWDMTIDDRFMTFNDRGNNVRVTQPTPKVIIGIAGEIYQTPRLGVNIVHKQCSDGMSDRIYKDTVQVDVDGRRYNGCGGGTVMPASLAGTSWTVESINGRATGGGERFVVQFEADRISGQFGCNRVSGPYSFNGDTFTAGALAMTRMACPDVSFEDQAAAILSAPLVTRMDGDRLTLGNPPNRIVLRRNL